MMQSRHPLRRNWSDTRGYWPHRLYLSSLTIINALGFLPRSHPDAASISNAGYTESAMSKNSAHYGGIAIAMRLRLWVVASLISATTSPLYAAKWEFTEEVLANKRVCVLYHSEPGPMIVSLVTEGKSAGIRVLFPGPKLRKKTATALISSGPLNLVDPHSTFEPPDSDDDWNSVYLEGPLDQVAPALGLMIEANKSAALMDKSGKVLTKWSWQGAASEWKKWVKCADRL